MDSAEFRAMQAPLKEKYRQNPQTAQVSFRREGHATGDLTFQVDTGRGPLQTGLHPDTSGRASRITAEDMLLEALVACTGVTLQAVATAMGIELRQARVIAEGEVDLRGTMAVSQDVPVGFQEIRLRFELDSDAPDDKLDRLMEKTERYCVVLQTLLQGPRITATRERTSQ